MITIHEKTAQTFETLGLGALVPNSCIVTEELNGAYELELKHPYDEGGKWQRLERGRILYASTPRGKQPFRIYYVKPTMDAITVNARHIFYDLLDNQCKPITHSGTAEAALTALQAAFAYPMPFSFDTDISITGTLTTGRMNPVQALLSDDDEATSFVKGYGGELLRDLVHGQEPPENGGHAHDDEDGPGGDVRQLHGVEHFLQGKLLGDEEADEKGVPHRDDRGFHGRAYARVDAAEDDHGSHEGPDVLQERPPEFGHRVGMHRALVAVAAGDGIGREHEAGADQRAGYETGGEQRGNRDVGDDAVDQHGVARRDEDAEGAARGAHASRVFRRIAAPDHRGDHDAAHGGHGAGAGADHGGEEHAAEDGHDAEPAAYVPDEHGGDLNDLGRHAAAFHERPGEDEAHHRQQGEHVRDLDKVNHDERKRDVAQKQHGDGRHAEGDEDGRAHDEQDSQRNPDEDFKRHQNTSSLGTTKGSRLVKMRHQRSTRRTACKVKAMGTAA